MKFLKFIVKVVAYCLVMPVVFVFSTVLFWNLIVPFFAGFVGLPYNSSGKDFLRNFLYWLTLPLTNFFRVARMVSEIVDEA